MAQNPLKREVSQPDDEAIEGHRKKVRKKTVIQRSEDVVKEFLKLTGVKQTKLNGFKQFLTTLKTAEEKHEIILKYLQSHPDCSQMFDVIAESPEERSLFEVQIVVEILEVIILELVKDDTRTKSQATVIVSRLLANHRKFVLSSLNSPSPSNFTMATLKLLTAIVMHGPTLAGELLAAFDFSHKKFGILANRRDKKVIVDVHTCFIKFVLSFFVTGDSQLIQQVLQIKGFATSILQDLHKDSAEIIHLILSTLTKIVENQSIMKKNKILLFTSYSLSQLARLYAYKDDSSVRDRVHHFLLKLCTSPHGITFESKLGIFSDRSNNPVLLRFLRSLRKAMDDNLLTELIIRILQHSQDLISPYLTGYQMVMDPHNTKQWLHNLIFIIKLYFHLSMPKSILKELAISADHLSTAKCLKIVCPENMKRNILTRGLQHPDAVVQGSMLSMMLVVLRRSCNFIQSSCIDDRILVSFHGDILKHLPSFQTLISIRENLNNRTTKARGDVSEDLKDLLPQVSVKDGTILLSRTLACMSLFQTLAPNCFTQSNYDPWKLLPRTKQEETLYNLSSKYSMLRIFQNCPTRHFKRHPQMKTVTSMHFKQILLLYCHEKDSCIISTAKDILEKFFAETCVGYSHKLEVSIWLHNVLDDCVHNQDALVIFLEKVYCRLSSDTFDLVDDVIESVHSVTHASEDVKKSSRAMPFTAIVPCALDLFASFVKDSEGKNGTVENLDNLARYLNLVLLDILELQTDPRPLCNMIVNNLAKGYRTYPLHTKLLLDFVTHWSTRVIECDLGISGTQDVSKKKEKKEHSKQILNLSPRQFKKQITSSDHIDMSFVISYLKCNPVLFDFENSMKFLKVLNGIPCSLLVRQLLVFVLKNWKSGTEISDNTALWDTFNSIVNVIFVAAKQESIESWERTVSNVLFFVSNVVEMYLDNSRNHSVVLEIARMVTEILRMTFDRLQEMSSSNSITNMDLDACDEIRPSVTDDDVVHDITNSDITNNDVIQEDILRVIDKTCDRKSPDENIRNESEVLGKFMRMVFGHDVLRQFFCGHVDASKTVKNGAGFNYVRKIISNCVGELLRHFHGEILQEKNCEYLRPYFLRIAQAVKEEDIDSHEMDVKLPYDVTSTSLLRIFHQYLSHQVLNEILQTYLNTPMEQFIEIRGCSEETVLSRNGEKFVEVLRCFLGTEESHKDDLLSSDVWDGVLHLLISINCPGCEEIIAMFVTKYSALSETTLSAVLNQCLNQPTCVRIQTAVLVVCQTSALLTQLQDWLLNRVNGKWEKKEARPEGVVTFLQNETEWNTFLPLLLFYLSVITKGPRGALSEQNEKCLNYIQLMSWQRLRNWLLEMKNTEKSSDCLKMLSLLLVGDQIDGDLVRNLYAEVTIKEHFVKLNLCQLEAVESTLQFVLKASTNKKQQKKYRTIFVYNCMQRLTRMMKNNDKDHDLLKLEMLQYLEIYGKESLRLEKIESLSIEDFVNVTNTFVKSALRFCFTCSKTLNVLSVLVKTIYTSCSSELLLPPADLYQFILNHSKFLEIFLGNSNTSGAHGNTKETLVDLVQTVVDLEPNCCEPLHVFLILGAYTATLSLSDQKLLRLLFTYENNLGDEALGSRMLWGEAAIEAYQAGKNEPTTLWHETNIAQILDLLDSKHLLQSAKHFPQYKPLQPDQCEDFNADSQFYDPSFLLPVFSYFLAPSREVKCRRFIESSALAYTINATTSSRKEMRQVAYQILSRFQQHLFSARFREKQQVTHLLHFFQNGIIKADYRISSFVASFMTRALHIFFYPEDSLYVSVNRYMLQRSFMDLRDVPLFLSHLNNSDLNHRTERTWLLHLILDGLRDPMDYHTCQKFQVFQQLFTLYNSAIADKAMQKLILKITHEVCRHHAAVYELCEKYGLIPWLHLLINTNSVPENFSRLVEILTTLWFTLIGASVSHDDEENNNNYSPLIPSNVCSELLLVLSSILQSTISSKMWSAEIFTSLTSLLVSLLDHQQRWTTSAEVTIAKQHCLQICQLWRLLFGGIDIHHKLNGFITKDVTASHKEITSEKWFVSMKNVLNILTYSHAIQSTMKDEETLSVNLDLLKLEGMLFDRFLQRKLRSALQIFITISDSDVSAMDRIELLLLSKIVSKGVWGKKNR